MYLLGKKVGYSTETNNNYTANTDYLNTNSWGYSSGCVNTFGGLVDYIENRNYYTCTDITVHPPITWDIWAQNWETIDTNWNNDII